MTAHLSLPKTPHSSRRCSRKNRNFSKRFFFGFNGKESDNSTAADSYDFGARIYDGRLGRWLSVDPFVLKYPFCSPFTISANSPIVAFDPDGRLVIFSNGEVGTFGQMGTSNNKDRANSSYWTTYFVDKIMNRLGETNQHFIDGDQGVTSGERYSAGHALAVKQAEKIIAGLARNEKGEITESIYFITHSKGAAFANGYSDALRTEINKQIADGKIKYAEGVNPLPLTIHNAPHQSGTIKIKETKTTTVAVTHLGDPLSDDDAQGDVLNIKTNKTEGQWSKLPDAHSISTFLYEDLRLIDQFLENKKYKAEDKYEGFPDSLNNVITYKKGKQ